MLSSTGSAAFPVSVPVSASALCERSVKPGQFLARQVLAEERLKRKRIQKQVQRKTSTALIPLELVLVAPPEWNLPSPSPLQWQLPHNETAQAYSQPQSKANEAFLTQAQAQAQERVDAPDASAATLSATSSSSLNEPASFFGFAFVGSLLLVVLVVSTALLSCRRSSRKHRLFDGTTKKRKRKEHAVPEDVPGQVLVLVTSEEDADNSNDNDSILTDPTICRANSFTSSASITDDTPPPEQWQHTALVSNDSNNDNVIPLPPASPVLAVKVGSLLTGTATATDSCHDEADQEASVHSPSDPVSTLPSTTEQAEIASVHSDISEELSLASFVADGTGGNEDDDTIRSDGNDADDDDDNDDDASSVSQVDDPIIIDGPLSLTLTASPQHQIIPSLPIATKPRRRSSRGSLCSMTSTMSMNTVVTNCDMQLDEEGVFIMSYSSSSPRQLAQGQTSVPLGTIDKSSPFRQNIESLLQSLMMSDSEDDETQANSSDDDDASLEGGIIGYDHGKQDAEDYHLVQGSTTNGMTKNRHAQLDWIVPADMTPDAPMIKPEQRGSRTDRLLSLESALVPSLESPLKRRGGRRVSFNQEGGIQHTTIMAKSSSDRGLSLGRHQNDLLARSSSDRCLSIREPQEHEFHQEAPTMMPRRLFLQGRDEDAASMGTPTTYSTTVLASSKKERRVSFQESDNDDDIVFSTPHHGIKAYPTQQLLLPSSPRGTKINQNKASPTSVRTLVLDQDVNAGERYYDGDEVGPLRQIGGTEDSLRRESLSWEEQQRPSLNWFSASMSTLKTDTDMNGYSQSTLMDFDEEEDLAPGAGDGGHAARNAIISNIDVVERLCTSDSHRRKLKNARLVVRVVLGQHRKDYKTSKACFQAIDIVTAFRREVHQAVQEISKGQQVWADLKTIWQQLWRIENAASVDFPPLLSDPQSVDSYEYAMLLMRKMYTILYPTSTPFEKPSKYASSLHNSATGPNDTTLFLGTVAGAPVTLSLSFCDADRTKRTRLTPYKHDNRYPLSLQDALRVVRAVLGPSHKRVSGQDCLRAIQMYGLLKIQFKRLSEQLDDQRSAFRELTADLERIYKMLTRAGLPGPNDMSKDKTKSGTNIVTSVYECISKRLPPAETMDPQLASIVTLCERISQILLDDDDNVKGM